MNASERQAWFGTAVVVGLLYTIIGVGFALPSNNVRMWRLAAWIVSALVYSTHIAYEHFRLRNTPRVMARHVALAAAIGAFGLAAVANVHEVRSASAYRPSLAVALVAWPALVALPAFVVALVLSYGLALTRTRR